MNVCSNTFSEVDEGNVSNCIVDRDTMLDNADLTAVQLQHGPY